MRFDRPTIALVPRTTADCLDLAIMFYGRHLRTLLALWAVFALPACAAVYGLSWWYELDLRMALVAVYVATVPLGLLLISAAAPSTFGEPFDLRRVLWRLDWRAARALGYGVALRCVAAIGPALMLFPPAWYLFLLGMVLAVIPGLWLAVRAGFLWEENSLRTLARHLHDRRAKDLVKEQSSDLLARGCWIVAFCLLLAVVLFVTLDMAAGLLFSFPILLGRLPEDGELAAEELFTLLGFDPLVMTALVGVLLAVYPVGRLAWFFCYLDARVRRDCWDMELQFLQDAQVVGGEW